jgi:NADH-quinone oxidoreductase subunit C
MEQQEIFTLLQEQFDKNKILEHVQTGDEKKGFRDPFILVNKESLHEVCLLLRDRQDTAFDMLHCVSGVDWPEYFESVYHLFSFTHRHKATIKVRVPKNEPHVQSVVDIWPAANWHERETYDLMGIVYDNHPDLTRILLPDEWEGHPLRKDYEMPDHDRLRELGL